MSGVLSSVAGGDPDTSKQNVVLTGREIPHTLHGFDVNIHPSLASSLESGSTAGSSKVKITTVTNQNWDLPTSRGTIVASNKQFLAYVLEGKSGHVLRLIQPETGNRALLKGFVGPVVDVSFAHINSSLLACVDQGGNVYIWDMEKVQEMSKAQTDALCVVLQRSYEVDSLPHRLVWSPYVVQDDEEDGPCVIVSHGNMVEVIDVQTVLASVTTGMKIATTKLDQGITTINDTHTKDVCDISLSPDGQVLATCSEDGHLKFWAVFENPPRCLHDFMPHRGEPVTRLIFCDDHTSQTNQFWRFLLTASANNSEIKLWCTVSWNCLQTIRFCKPIDGPDPHILMNLDLSAAYLVVTDAKRVAVYVTQLVMDGDNGSACLTSLTEYLLRQPIFSFVVSGPTYLARTNVGGDSSDSEGETTTMQPLDPRLNTIGLKLHTIHSKSMQELEIRFDPPDLTGVPPAEVDLKLEPPSLNGPPLSLPTLFGGEVKESSVGGYHSLTDISSPKLLTPSQFLSPTKTEPLLPSPSDFTSPLTTPINALQTTSTSLTSVTMETLSTAQVMNGDEDVSVTSMPSHPLLHRETVEHVSTDYLEDPSIEENTVEKELIDNPVEKELSDNPIDKNFRDNSVEKELRDNSVEKELSEESDKDISPETAQKALSDIFETLQLEPPSLELSTQTYEEFKQALSSHPILTSTEKSSSGPSEFVSLSKGTTVGGHISGEDEVVNPTTAATPPESFVSEESDKDISPETAQKALSDIFETLQLEPPSLELSTQTYEEFKQALSSHPILTSTEKSSSGPSEFVSLSKGTTVGGHISGEDEVVNPTTAATPPESFVTLKRVVSPGDSPNKEEEAWPEIGGPDIPTMIVSKGSDIPVVSASSISEDVPLISEELTMPPGNEDAPLVSEELTMPPGNEDAPLISEELTMPPGNEDVPLVSEELMMPPGNEDAPLVSEELTMPPGNEDAPLISEELTMPPGNVESTFASFETPKLLLADEARDVLSTAVDHSLVSDAGVKGRVKRGRKKKKSKGLTVETTELNSQSEGEHSEGAVAMPTVTADLIALVAKHQDEIRQLREEQGRGLFTLQSKIDQLQTCLLDAQTRGMEQQNREQQSRLERVLKERGMLDKQRQEKLVSALTSTLSTSVKTKLDHLVRNEMKNLVLPAMVKSMSSIQNDLSAIVSQRVTATDTLVRDSINQILQTRGLSESIGGAVANSLQRLIVSRYEDAFKSTILPGFEKACQEMFRQIDDSFRRGTTEYLGQLAQHNRQLTDVTLQQITGSMNSLAVGGQIQACLHQEMNTVIQHVQQVVVESVSTAVAKEVEAAFEQHAKTNPEVKVQEDKKRKEEDIVRLIGEQRFNSAFELALSTSDLKLVMFLCTQLNPDDAFDKTPCPLSQPVLLSLIQQLSVDLQDQLELKIRYLEQSILALDVGNDVTKSHMTPVVSQLSQQLTLLEQSFQMNPTTPTMSKQVKRLGMMALHMSKPSN